MTQASCRLLTRPWPAVSRQGERTGPPSSVSGGPGSQAQLPVLRICSGRLHRTSVSRAPEPEVHERPWEQAHGSGLRCGSQHSAKQSGKVWMVSLAGGPGGAHTTGDLLSHARCSQVWPQEYTLILSFKSYIIFSTGRKPAQYTPWIQNQPTSSFAPSEVMPLVTPLPTHPCTPHAC